jgi:hypothetical protein
VRRAKGLVLLAQQSVSDTIELQLRHLIVEMDGLLHSANFLHLLTRDELLRLKRIVGLCNDVTASLEDIADADLTSHSAESVGSSLERLLEGHDRAAAATAAAGGGGTLRCRNRPSLRVSFNLPVGDDTDHDGCGSSVNGVADGSAMRRYLGPYLIPYLSPYLNLLSPFSGPYLSPSQSPYQSPT